MPLTLHCVIWIDWIRNGHGKFNFVKMTRILKLTWKDLRSIEDMYPFKALIYTPVNDTDAWLQNNEKCYMSNPHSIGDILIPYSWYFCTRNVFHSLQVYINYTRNKSTRKRVFIFNVPLRRIWIYVFWYFEVSRNVLTAYRLGRII